MLSDALREDLRWKWWSLKRLVHRPAPPRNPEGRVYVHLGCGSINHPRFVNVDARPWPHVHHVGDIERLPMFAAGSVDLIYVCHALEHIGFREAPAVLQEWHRALRPGGILRLSVPDFDRILAIYEDNGRQIEVIEKTLMGGQSYEHNFHRSVYNHARLARLLEQAGFTDVAAWTPGADELSTFSDWSVRTVQICEKNYPVSLNLQGRRKQE